jgi:phage-related holin
MIAVCVLLIADFITGVWASIKLKGWESINSRRMAHSITKIILYNLAIIISYMTQTYLFSEIPWLDISVGFIASVEIFSMYENIKKITGLDISLAVKGWIVNRKSDASEIFKGVESAKVFEEKPKE